MSEIIQIISEINFVISEITGGSSLNEVKKTLKTPIFREVTTF